MTTNAHTILRRSVPCYFCNEFLEERYLPEHVKHCGAVLQECPQKCGVYVPRKNMQNHEKSCFRRTLKRYSGEFRETQDTQWRDKVFSVLTLLRKAIDEEEKERKKLQECLTKNLNFLFDKQESFDVSRLSVMEGLEEIRRNNSLVDQRLNDLEITYDTMEQRTSMSFQKISEQLKLLQNGLNNERKENDKLFDEWRRELKEVKTFVAKESVLASEMWQEQLQRIHDLKLELEMRCKDSKELLKKQNELSERIDYLAREVRDQSKVATEQEKKVKALKFQVKENLHYVEELIKDNSSVELGQDFCYKCSIRDLDPFSTNGRLLWRIDRYKEKMSEAKENDSAIYSPIFLNKEYGYTLKMELLLNGKGQWKDRHVIGCLRVEIGKWDPLLDWPCILKAIVVLKDQENPANDLRKIVKTVCRSKEDCQKPDKESGMYMFIPHTSLARNPGYTKNDVMFLDIQVKDVKTNDSTASLVA